MADASAATAVTKIRHCAEGGHSRQGISNATQSITDAVTPSDYMLCHLDNLSETNNHCAWHDVYLLASKLAGRDYYRYFHVVLDLAIKPYDSRMMPWKDR